MQNTILTVIEHTMSQKYTTAKNTNINFTGTDTKCLRIKGENTGISEKAFGTEN